MARSGRGADVDDLVAYEDLVLDEDLAVASNGPLAGPLALSLGGQGHPR